MSREATMERQGLLTTVSRTTQIRPSELGVVVIGRNEGERLRACLASIPRELGVFVYVDSGSIDGSVDEARLAGANVVDLDESAPFSAARARNEGFHRLRDIRPDVRFVQFIDGDCAIDPDWSSKVTEVFEREHDVVAVCGRREEVFREASVYKRISDAEWSVAQAGDATAFGGEIAIRVKAFVRAGEYDPKVIAFEDDELAVRLRANGGRIRRLDETSSYHDAAITKLSEWWRRAVRCGHGYAQVGAMHGGSPEYYFVRERSRVALYGGLIPFVAAAFAPFTQGWSLTLLLAHVLQFVRLRNRMRRKGLSRDAGLWSFSCVAAQPANLMGMLEYYRRSWVGAVPQIIEYKRSS